MRTLLKRSVAVFSNMIKSHSGFWSPLLIVSFCLISSLAHPVSTSRISSSFLSFILFHDFLEPMSLFLIYVFLTNTVHCLIYDNLFGELMEFGNYEHGLCCQKDWDWPCFLIINLSLLLLNNILYLIRLSWRLSPFWEY